MTDENILNPDDQTPPESTPVDSRSQSTHDSIPTADGGIAESPRGEAEEQPRQEEPATPSDAPVENETVVTAAVETHAEAPAVEPAVDEQLSEAPVAEMPEASEQPEPEPASEAEPPSPPAEPEPKAKPKRTRKSKTAAAKSDESEAATAVATATPDSSKKWYAVKIQSGREESIKSAIERKVKIEGLEQYFGQIVIPVEEVNEKKKVKVKVKDKKTGEVETTTQERNVVKKIKKFPGYLFTEVEFNDEILYVFRETSGVGDFVGIPARRGQGGERQAPTPMTEAEVQSMLTGVPAPGGPRGGAKKTVVKLDYEKGDKVRIKNGAFAGHEAEVKAISEAKDPTDSPKVTVVVTMWGRGVDVTLDYWEVDKA
jgi:transcriptional antiterminator NusG